LFCAFVGNEEVGQGVCGIGLDLACVGRRVVEPMSLRETLLNGDKMLKEEGSRTCPDDMDGSRCSGVTTVVHNEL